MNRDRGPRADAAAVVAMFAVIWSDSASAEEVDRIVWILPLWVVADTHVTPLIAFDERRQHVQAPFNTLAARA
jgi:hypothetical protein